MFNCTPSWNWQEFSIMMVLRVILKSILKVNFRLISWMMKSQSNFGKLAIKCKIGLRLFLFFLFGTQNIWCIAYSVYFMVWGKRKINKFIPDGKYIARYPSEHFQQMRKSLTQISELIIWCLLHESLDMEWIWKVCCI